MPDALEGEWSLSKVENITGWSSYAYIESDPKLTLNEKRLLNMVTSFCLNGSKGALTLKNFEIGVLLNLAPKSVGNLVSSLEGKKRIVIENRQSPYRRLLLPSDSGTDSVTLPRTSGSEEYPLPSNSGSTSIPQCLTSTPEWNHFHSPVEHNKRIELNKKIKGLSSSEYKRMFQEAYDLYEGTKGPLNTEYFGFKNVPDWANVLPLLKPAIEKQIKSRQILKAQNKFIPEWKHFKNWLKDRGWEEVTEIDRQEEQKQQQDELKKERQWKELQEYLFEMKQYVLETRPEILLVKVAGDPKLEWVVRQLRPEILQNNQNHTNKSYTSGAAGYL